MLYFKTTTFCDSSENWQLHIQDPATPIAEGMFFFHTYLMFFIIAIGIFVCAQQWSRGSKRQQGEHVRAGTVSRRFGAVDADRSASTLSTKVSQQH